MTCYQRIYSREWSHRRVLNCHCLFFRLMLYWQSSLHDGTRQQQVVDCDFNEALICFHHLRLWLLLTENRGWGRYEGWREGNKSGGGGGSISSLGESEGWNDCRGADVCCSNIKQQLVCRNKLQGYWFTIHLLPFASSTHICVCVCVYAGIICYTVFVSVYVLVSFFWWFFACVWTCFMNSVCTLGNTPFFPSLCLSHSPPVCMCVSLCVHA